jgi:hypothetical protein
MPISPGRVQLLGGFISLTAPLILAALADAVGLRNAFAVEPLLIVLSLVALKAGLGSRQSSRGDGSEPAGTSRTFLLLLRTE